MPNCKFCGTPVNAANVFHSACWETQVEKMAEEFCDNYCLWPLFSMDEDALNEHCDNCAPIKALNLGLGCEKMPLTNADRIRSMSDEELAAYIVELTDGVYCLHLEACYEDLHGDGGFPEERCRACAVKWLRSEADAKTTQSVPGI